MDPTVVSLFESGVLPVSSEPEEATYTKRSPEEKKRKQDDIILEMRAMLENGQDEQCFAKFPRTYLQYGERLKAMIVQKRDFFKTNGDPHIWIVGNPGSGKSAILQVVYPKYYNKNLENRFFDLYEPTVHTHVLLQDVDHDVVERLGVQFLKTICDEAGFPIDKKYKTPQIIRTTALVSSNFTIQDVLPEDMHGRRENLAAMLRRFYQVNINAFLMVLGVKLLSTYELRQLKKEGNTDPTKLFIAWDYSRDLPTGEPLKTPEEYQELVKKAYYG